MFDTVETFDSPSGASLLVRHRRAQGPVRATVMVQHGLAEHGARYAPFAQALSAIGFNVMVHDHRGHGGTTAPDAPPRRFAADDGPATVIADGQALRRHAGAIWGDVPQILFGHSMGGLIAVNMAQADAHGLAGLCAWNCNFDIGLQQRVAGLALRIEKMLKGSDTASQLFKSATFDLWRKSVSPRRTDFDWLSHDVAEVDAYRADPLCGWTPTNSMARDLLSMVVRGGGNLGRLPAALPVHLVGGTADPATDHGRATRRLADGLAAAGSRDIRSTVVPGARHESLQELPAYRDPAMQSLVTWLDRVAP